MRAVADRINDPAGPICLQTANPAMIRPGQNAIFRSFAARLRPCRS